MENDLSVFKIFTLYIGLMFDPPINYDSQNGESDWIKKVNERIKKLKNNGDDYNTFIHNMSLSYFIKGKTEETIIKTLNEYFPSILKDVIKFLCVSNNYDCLTNIVNCIDKYFPDKHEETSNIIKQ